MNNYRKVSNGLSPQALQLKKRILKNRKRAIYVGLLYLLGIIALAGSVLLFFPAMSVADKTSIRITEFYTLLSELELANAETWNKGLVCLLCAVILIVVLYNLCRAIFKLKWLYKKSANQAYGFNRNVYAMLDLGKLFSSSFVVILVNYFLISIICKTPSEVFLAGDFLIILIIGIVIHFIGGFAGAKARFYDVEDGQVIEQVRVVGRFAPLFRNLVQVVAVLAMMFYLVSVNTGAAIIAPLLDGSVTDVLGNPNATADALQAATNQMIICAALTAGSVFLIPLAKHATAITEYNIDGVEGKGMKTFRIFSLFAFLAFIAAVAYDTFIVGSEMNMEMVIVAAIAFVMFVFELLMRKRPKYPEDRADVEKVRKDEDREINLYDFSKNYADNVVECPMDKSQAELAANNEAMAPVPAYAPVAQGQAQPYPQPYPMPYPVPYVQPQPPQPPQQPCMPMGMMSGMGMNGMSSMLPVMAGLALLPTLMNGMNQQQLNNVQGQNVMLPSQMMKEALAKRVPAREAEKILYPDMVAGNKKKSRKEKRREEKERQRRIRFMERPVVAEEATPLVNPVAVEETTVEKAVAQPDPELLKNPPVTEEEEDVVDDATDLEDVPAIKIDVECPCCHKKLRITSVALYNRCPSCKTVFQVRKVQK